MPGKVLSCGCHIIVQLSTISPTSLLADPNKVRVDIEWCEIHKHAEVVTRQRDELLWAASKVVAEIDASEPGSGKIALSKDAYDELKIAINKNEEDFKDE